MFSLFFDGSAAGIDRGLDLNAVHCLPSNAHLLVAFDGSGTVGGFNFAQADVLEFTPMGAGWELSYQGLAQPAGWYGAEIQALSAVAAAAGPAKPPAFKPNSGSPGTGLFAGSTRVFGMGVAYAKPADTCIAIFAVGPNGVPDAPPGSVDDELLGIGGTAANGNFVDEMGNPGIPLSRPIQAGERIFPADVCSDSAGGVAIVATPSPLMGEHSLILSIVVLILIGARSLFWTSLRR